MGTRGALGWLINGEIKASYNHYDSYPKGLGADLQRDLRAIGKIPSPDHITWVDQHDDPGTVDVPYGVGTQGDWYSRLRKQQGELQMMLDTGYATDDSDFPESSLFCEWAYLLDAVKQRVLLLEGFNKNPAKQFAPCAVKTPVSGYFGCSLRADFTYQEFIDADMGAFED